MSEGIKTSSPNSGKGLSPWQKRLLVVVLVVNLGLYGAVWFLNQDTSSGRSSQKANVAVGERLALRDAYAQALALALDWQADAQLVGAAASWQMASGDSLTLNRAAWSFRFFSPTVHQIQIVEVDPRGAQAGRQQPVKEAPQAVVPDWSLGSDELLLTFLTVGGRDFIATHPGANVHLQLKGEEGNRSVWYITAVDPVATGSLIVGVDANTRQVVLSDRNLGGG
jgi:hypothetical protein